LPPSSERSAPPSSQEARPSNSHASSGAFGGQGGRGGQAIDCKATCGAGAAHHPYSWFRRGRRRDQAGPRVWKPCAGAQWQRRPARAATPTAGAALTATARTHTHVRIITHIHTRARAPAAA
jgi:hypothetical protein